MSSLASQAPAALGPVFLPARNLVMSALSWVPLVVLVVVMGAVEFIGPDKSVTNRVTADTLMEIYHQYCAANGIQPLDLLD